MNAEKVLKKPSTPRKSKKYFFEAKKKLPNKLNIPSKIAPKPVPTSIVENKEKIEKEIPNPKTLLKKPFQEIKSTSKKYRKHKSSSKVKEEKHNAGLLTAEKTNKSAANRNHLEVIPEEKKEFQKVSFKDKLQKQINDTIKSADDAKKVGKNGVKKADTDSIAETLTSEKEAAGGKIETGIIKPPEVPVAPANEVTKQEPVALFPEKLESTTTTKQKTNLAPAKKPDEETDLTKKAKGLDDQYANNNLSKEKLQNSNEPTFIDADNQKEESQAKAEELTQEVRTNEKNTIGSAKSSNSKLMNAAYNSMFLNNTASKTEVFSTQSEKSTEEKATRNRIESGLNDIYNATNNIIIKSFKAIDDHIEDKFGAKLSENLNKFSARVNELLDDNDGIEWLGKVVTNQHVQDDVEIFDIAKAEFIQNMQKPIDDLVKVVDDNLLLAAEAVKNGKIKKDEYWQDLPENDKKVADDIFEIANEKFDNLETSVENKENSVIETVTEKFSEALKDLDERFEKAKIENMSWWERAVAAIMSVINTIIELKNAIKAIAKKAAKYAEAIIDDPITFFGNLADAVGQGFTNFRNNIDKHLIKGVLDWLTGSLAGSEIVLPKEFNLEGITSLVLQILGITIKKIKEIVIDVIGEERFAFIEKGVDSAISAGNKILNIFKILNEKGLAGLWEFIQEEFGNLKEMLIENVKTFVIETITFKAVEFLLSLLIPGAGFIRAAQLLIKFVITLFQKAAQILKIIDGIIDSFGDILNKNLAAATEKVESVFANFLSLAISFLAAVLGLNGIVAKVRNFIQQKLRPLIDNALKKIAKNIKTIADKIGLTKLIDSSMKAVEKGKDWVEEKKKKAKDTAMKYGGKIINFLKIRKKFKTNDGEIHTLYYENKGENGTLMVASKPKTFEAFLKQIGKVEGNKAVAKKEAETEFDALQKTIKTRNMGANDEEYIAEQTKKYDKVNSHVNTLSNYMPPLFDITGIGEFQLVFGPLSKSGYGTKMEIKNLHKSTKPPIGSVPGVTNKAYDTLRKKRNGKSTYYILGHLLNHNLGGSGNDFKNLTPLTRKGNKDHSADIEETVKKELDLGKVIDYTVIPYYGSPNKVKNKPENLSPNKQQIVDEEEKTPVKVDYIFKSWDKDKPNDKKPHSDYFNNEPDFIEKAEYLE